LGSICFFVKCLKKLEEQLWHDIHVQHVVSLTLIGVRCDILAVLTENKIIGLLAKLSV
jgi:hypothetical protein